MNVSSVVDREWVGVDLAADDLSEAIHKVADLLPESLQESVLSYLSGEDREVSPSSFSVGQGVAFPHVRTDQVEGIQAAIGLFPDGVPFESSNGEPLRVVVLFLISGKRSGLYLKLLSSFSQIFSSDVHLENLLQSQSPGSVLSYLDATGEQLVGDLSLHDLVVPTKDSLRASDTVSDAIQVLAGEELDLVPVIDEGGHLLGTVDHNQLIRAALRNYVLGMSVNPDREMAQVFAEFQELHGDEPVTSVMDSDPFVLANTDTIKEAIFRLVEADCSYAFVVSDGRLVGRLELSALTSRVLKPGVV